MPFFALRFIRSLFSVAAFVASLLWAYAASAITMEQIQEACRASVAPQVKSCMQAKKGAGNREANLEACRNTVRPKVRDCMDREFKKAAQGKAAPATPQADAGGEPIDLSAITTTLVAPPRTINDITAILDNERPDDAKIGKLKADADASPPTNAPPKELSEFYYDRGQARALLARNADALSDALMAIEIGSDRIDVGDLGRIRRFASQQYQGMGETQKAVALLDSILRESIQQGRRGPVIAASRNKAQIMIAIGNVREAEALARNVGALVQEARGSPNPRWRSSYLTFGASWEADSDTMRGLVFASRGQYREAEAAYLRAEAFRRNFAAQPARDNFVAPQEQSLLSANTELLNAARMKSKQGRHSEAEADARRALLETLKNNGKYNPSTPRFINGLANILIEQGRYTDAEKLLLSALDIQRTLGISDGAQTSANILSQLGNAYVVQRKYKDAIANYTLLEQAISAWEPRRRNAFLLNGSRISALYASGQVDAGIAAAEQLLKDLATRLGEIHSDTASARGNVAIGYAMAGRDAEAIREFKAAIPAMTAAARANSDEDETSLVAAKAQRLQRIVETYISVLGRVSPGSHEVGLESFALADAIRGQSVQQALASSSARMAAKDPAMADLVRNEQDLEKQINAQLGMLNNALSLPSSQRDDAMVRTLNAGIDKLRTDRRNAQREITKRFPAYAELIDPTPPTVPQIQQTLRPDEAFLSFYFGRTASFVWAVPKSGPIAFAVVPMSSASLEKKVHKLREALEPQATMLSDIPDLDLAAAYELYTALLKPVEAAWKPAKSLVVVTNGALGLLPLSLLPTAPSELKSSETHFGGYRDVPWLARTHAVSLVPSASALRTLRGLPPGKAERQDLIGFGDPFFSAEQLSEAEAEVAHPAQAVADAANVMRGSLRGVRLVRRSSPQLDGVDSAGLAMLPRLPDTADELKSIAAALEADPAKVLYLGKQANEKLVKSLDLSGFKTVAFATHGLVPGDLNGLLQPALALSAPEVSDSDGDGLLTMEEILALKLDADWVVLSACNTGTGAGAGAEAASGLGRAFFYAGTRALLVTNWSVHSASARDLVTDLFRRQAADAAITRSEALRQSMLALIDGRGFTDESGKPLFSYAHPLFWAPYSIIGDGGRG